MTTKAPRNGVKTGQASIETLTTQAKKTIDGSRERAGKAYAASRDTAGRLYGDARDRTYRLADATNRLVQEHPVAAAAMAVAAGAAIAALFPRVRSVAKLSAKGLSVQAHKAVDAVDTQAAKDKANTLLSEAGQAIAARVDTAALKEKATEILAEASKAVTARIDTDALKANAFALADRAKTAALSKAGELDEVVKAKALDAAAYAGEKAAVLLHKAGDAVTEAARKTKP